MTEAPIRIGIDLGGTKIAGIALGTGDAVLAEARTQSPREDYAATVRAVADMVGGIRRQAGRAASSIGVGMPGSITPATGLAQNANSTWLNGRPFAADLETALGEPVRLANDANCFALSEAADGAGRDCRIVFGVIIGTGCGGGIVHRGRLLDGPRGIGGEWGHNPLPWPSVDEHPGPRCWCGRNGCMETWVAGPGLAADHAGVTGEALTAPEIAARAEAGEAAAAATLDRHASRLARGLAAMVNVLDPDVIVLGGGLSELAHLYVELPRRMLEHLFTDRPSIAVRPPRWGAASGVRGAARLWDEGAG
jgi:fructokinase